MARVPRTVAAAALLASLAAACGSASRPTSGSATTPGATSVSDATGLDALACSLLGAPDVAAAIGQAAGDPRPGAAAPGQGVGASTGSCTIAAASGGADAFAVTVEVERFASVADAERRFADLTTRAEPVSVDGLDEAGFTTGGGPAARLRHGADVVSVDVHVAPALPPEHAATALASLAKAVSGHYAHPAAG